MRAKGNELRLWAHQTRTLARVGSLTKRGVRRVLIVLPTGGGKTIVAVRLIRAALARGERVLFVAHVRELIDQAVKRLVDGGVPAESIGVMMGQDERTSPDAPVQVASIQTLSRRKPPEADIVLVDEAHRALADSYRTIAALYPGAAHVGLTATPSRLDGRGLADAYEEIVAEAKPSELIAAGILAEPVVYTVPDDRLPALAGIRTTAGDFQADQLEAAVNQTGLVGDIIAEWTKRAEGRRTVVFATSIAHSRDIVARFVAVGVRAEHLDGKTPVAEREAILARLESGAAEVVSNVGVLGEGWDLPCCKCLVLARPTKSLAMHIQQSGRILRPWQGLRPLILDHAGNVHRHGFPHQDRDWTLKDGAIKEKATAKTCSACMAVVPIAARPCPECGYEPEVLEERELPAEDVGELVPLSPPDVSARVDALARSRGLSREWSASVKKHLLGGVSPAIQSGGDR